MAAPDRKEYFRKYFDEPTHRYRTCSPFKAPWGPPVEEKIDPPKPRFSYAKPPENMEILDIKMVENDNRYYYPIMITVLDKDTGAVGTYVTPDGGRTWNPPCNRKLPNPVIEEFNQFIENLPSEKFALARLRMVLLSVVSIDFKDPIGGKTMKLIPFTAGYYEWRFDDDDFPTDMEPGDIVLVNDDIRRPFYDIEKIRRHMPSGVRVIRYGG